MALDPLRTTRAGADRLGAMIIVIRVFAAFALLTGGLDLVLGTKLLLSSGAVLSQSSAADPVLNSQIGYWGAVWCGFGAVLWWSTRDLRARALGCFKS